MTSSTSSKPAILLVHGSWHSPQHMAPLTDYLTGQGYKVVVPALPSVHAEDVTKITLTDDIALLRSEILNLLDSNNVIVISHSYGTIPTSGALEDLDTASRSSSSHKTSVTAFLIIAGLLIPSGTSVLKHFGGQAPPQDVRGPLLYPRDPPGPGYLFYHDAPFDVAVECARTLKPQAWAVNTTDLPFAGHLVVKTRYLICEKDNALPAAFQRILVDTAREAGGDVSGDTIDSSHSPFLSRTEVVGRWVRKYGGGEKDVIVEELGGY